jgi:hypothetical protein
LWEHAKIEHAEELAVQDGDPEAVRESFAAESAMKKYTDFILYTLLIFRKLILSQADQGRLTATETQLERSQSSPAINAAEVKEAVSTTSPDPMP